MNMITTKLPKNFQKYSVEVMKNDENGPSSAENVVKQMRTKFFGICCDIRPSEYDQDGSCIVCGPVKTVRLAIENFAQKIIP